MLRPSPSASRWLSAILLAVLLAAGCGRAGDETGLQAGGEVTASPPTTAAMPVAPAIPPGASLVAEAQIAKVPVFSEPDESQAPRRSLANPTESGAPLVFLVEKTAPGWLQVNLPVRPNGSTGWIRAADVNLVPIEYRVVVNLRSFRITVYRGSQVILSEPVGLGTSSTPTPGGKYYIKELLKPPNPNGAYGPYAYGLSGFSNVLTSFAGGDGVVGIHGTNDPSSIGRSVSHGCIRMSNSGITTLAKTLPLGTPVEIQG
ncbi:MAG TPA: L,D-transpeptidase [Acidimicrobiales bacterium]|nr:L,D-transpeptidase [Acidimicrobiales bacterium]